METRRGTDRPEVMGVEGRASPGGHGVQAEPRRVKVGWEAAESGRGASAGWPVGDVLGKSGQCGLAGSCGPPRASDVD